MGQRDSGLRIGRLGLIMQNDNARKGAYYILSVLALALVIWRTYSYLQGTSSLENIGIPLSFLIILIATIFLQDRNQTFYYILVGIGFILAIASLVSIFLI